MSKSEYYILTVAKFNKSSKYAQFFEQNKFFVVVPNRKALSELYALMPLDTYRVEAVTTLNETKSFEEFKKELTQSEDNKPKGLDFGN